MRSLALFVATLALLSGAASRTAAGPAELRLSLHYDGRLLIKVFDMRVEQRVTTSGHSSTARFQSYGILAAFKRFDMRVASTGPIVRGEPMPGAFTSKNYGSKTKRGVSATWRGDDVITTASPAYANLGEPPASRAQKLAAADPLTQVMRMTLDRSRAAVCDRTVRFFDGKQLYDLKFSNPTPVTPGGRERRLGLVKGLRCEVRFQEVAGFKAKPPEQKDQGLKHGITVEFGQVGPRGPWVLSALRASTPLGRGSVELASVVIQGVDPTR